MATKTTKTTASKGLKVSETASEEMTVAVLKKRAVKRFEDANNRFTDREFFLDIGARTDAAEDGKTAIKPADILRLHKILLGEDKDAVVKLFNDDAAKVDQFVDSIMSTPSVKKA